MPRVPLVATAMLLLAGCVSPATETDPATAPPPALAGWWEDALPSSLTDPKHDHSVRAHHANITTPNFEVVGWDPLVAAYYEQTPTGMGCGGAATREDGRRIAIVHTISTDVAFVVADVTDPAHPVMLGEFLMPNVVVWDADISADGMHVLVAADLDAFGTPDPVLPPVPGAPQLTRVQPMWRDACTGQTRAAGPEQYLPFPGVALVGIQDPASPTMEDFVHQPYLGPHSVGSQMIDGTVYATSSVTNLVHEASYYTLFEIADTPAGSRLLPLSVIQVPGHPGVGFQALNGHVDVFLHKHPATGQVLAYLANWDGMYVYDVTDPRLPAEVSVWMDGDAGSVHTTYPFPTLVGDRQYLVVGQEVSEPESLPSGWIYILDVTDPGNPTEVSRWTLPVKPKWDDGGLQFSPHYVAILNETMFVTNYHGGLWAVDIGNLSDPRAVGIFVPDRESPAPFGGAEGYGPSVEDVIVAPDGLLTIWDAAGGVYQLRFREDVEVPPAPAWVVAGE